MSVSELDTKQLSAEKTDFEKRSWPELVFRYGLMAALLVLFVGPFVWMLALSFRAGGNMYSTNLIPDEITLENYRMAWSAAKFEEAFINSVIVAVLQVGLNVLFCSMAAYPLARMDFPGKKIVFLLIISTLMIPFQLFMIPLFLLCQKVDFWVGNFHFHLLDSLAGIILPGSVGAFGIYLLKQYYQGIPGDLEEAARIDGAGEFRIWWSIMMPLTRPAVAALSIFIFVMSWSNFLWPLIVIQSDDKNTLPIAVARLTGTFADNTAMLAAGSIIAIFPIIIFFAFLQRFFIGGLTLGSVKG